MASPKTDPLMEKIVSLCKRKGFVFQSSEIYGGLNSCWDFGPLGVELKRNIKDHWWKAMTHRRDDIEGIDAAILMHPQVWVTSGHVAGFTDPLVDCKECKARFRLDQIEEAECGSPAYKGRKASKCHAEGKFTEPRNFNLMFKTFMGPVEEDAATVYMRPETAQGIYVNFLNVMGPMRRKPPFGIAQIGKAFRNEISPGNFIFRSREFEQMEMQYFIDPKDDQKWFEYWKEERLKFYHDLGIRKEKLRFHQHGPGELAHYAKDAYDIEYEFPFGWKEFEGIHNRTDFDLGRHKEASGVDLSFFDEESKQRYVPYIIETSAGADRTTLVCLVDGYKEEEVKGEKRVSISLDPRIAPIKVAIFPLVNRDGMDTIAMNITNDLRTKFKVFYDDKGAVGRRYRRMDEVGTPFCVTVDSQTLEDQTVTIRHRDSMEQERMNMSHLGKWLSAAVGLNETVAQSSVTIRESKVSPTSTSSSVEDLITRHVSEIMLKQEHFRAFACAEWRAEGWVQGEFLRGLQQEKESGKLTELYCEYRIQRGDERPAKVDVAFRANGVLHLVEFKAFFLGGNLKSKRGLPKYLKQLSGDLDKMNSMQSLGQMWMVAFFFSDSGARTSEETSEWMTHHYPSWQSRLSREIAGEVSVNVWSQ